MQVRTTQTVVRQHARPALLVAIVLLAPLIPFLAMVRRFA
jgi:hypothetical protein